MTPRLKLLCAVTTCLLAMIALGASSASAEYLGHVFSGRFEGAGTHLIGSGAGIAVDNSAGPSHGDIYVADTGYSRVEKFDASGNFILMFGDEVNETTEGDVCPVNPGDVCKPGTPGGGSQQLGQPHLIAVDNSSGPSEGDVYVTEFQSRTVRKYNEHGVLQTGWGNGGVLTGAGSANGGAFERAPGGIVVDSAGNLDVLSTPNEEVGGKIIRFQQDGTPIAGAISSCNVDNYQGGIGLSPDDHYFYKLSYRGQVTRFSATPGDCVVFSESEYKSHEQSGKQNLVVDDVTGTVFGLDGQFFNGKRVSEYLLDATGKFPLNPAGEPCSAAEMQTNPEYEYGCKWTHLFGEADIKYGSAIGLNSSTNTIYVSDRPEGSTSARIDIFSPLNVPKATTGGTTAVAQTTATVTGHVDPDGAGTITECFVEFGPTTTYGNKAPCAPAAPINSPTDVEASLSKLSSGHVYHYRVVAVNALGSAKGADRTLITTAPPSIDSFSSSDLTATTAVLHATIVPNSIPTTYRFEYGISSAYGSEIPIGGKSIGDGAAPMAVQQEITGLGQFTYHFRVVAENELGKTVTEDQTFNFFPPDCPNRTLRQATGSDYLPDCRAYELVSPSNAGNIVFTPTAETPVPTYATDPARLAFMGSFGTVSGTEPPNGLDDMYTATRSASGWHTSFIGRKGNEVQDNCYENADRQLAVFLVFRCEYFIFQGVEQPPQNLPFIFNAEGKALGRWPVSAPLIEGSDQSHGAYQPSADFSHLAFSSNDKAFAPNGLTHAPGSAYDYDTATGSTKIISYDASGHPIGQEPGNTVEKGEYIMFPGVVPTEYAKGKPRSNNTHPSVSADGSHILMSTSSGPYEFFSPEPIKPVRLYMRVNDLVTYEVSDGHAVKFVGMTEDGSKVFFLSGEHLTPDDHDTSTDLFMWSEATGKIIRISAGEGGSGDTDSCTPTAGWTEKCNVQVPESRLGEFEYNGTDNFISSNGDIYFYSPERLVGVDAAAGEQNLYLWHDGELRYVTAAKLTRVQTTPDDSRMAFITGSRVLSFDNKGFQEMYTYDPPTRIIRCVSCPTEGKSLTGDVEGSLNGRYITNNGRTFFYSPDAQVPYDTNHLRDVYEFVDGRPQLITTGTADLDSTTTPSGQKRKAGLVGVSADGVNAYFATFDTLVPEDQNGQFIKFYDARTGGGFPVEVPLQPCQAADECHGPSAGAPVVPTISSGDELGRTGNASPVTSSKKKAKSKRKRAHRRKHHRHARRSQGASR